MLINVVVAVLLEKCLASDEEEEKEDGEEGGAAEDAKSKALEGPSATAAEVAELRAQMAMVLQALKELQVRRLHGCYTRVTSRWVLEELQLRRLDQTGCNGRNGCDSRGGRDDCYGSGGTSALSSHPTAAAQADVAQMRDGDG